MIKGTYLPETKNVLLFHYVNWLTIFSSVLIAKLKGVYSHYILPLEKHYLFDKFHSPPLSDADFEAKPMILLVGQYSTGKSTFIRFVHNDFTIMLHLLNYYYYRHLIKQDYPGMRVGPEPTTDKFIILKYNEDHTSLPGHALAVDSGKQFFPLSRFGSTFLNRWVR